MLYSNVAAPDDLHPEAHKQKSLDTFTLARDTLAATAAVAEEVMKNGKEHSTRGEACLQQVGNFDVNLACLPL